MNLVGHDGDTMHFYDVEALRKCLNDSEELSAETKLRVLKAIDESLWSKGKDFPISDILFVLGCELDLNSKEMASVLTVINTTRGLTKEIRIKEY